MSGSPPILQKLAALSLQQKLILFFGCMTITIGLLSSFLYFVYTNNQGYINNMARKRLTSAGVDVGDLGESDHKASENIVATTTRILEANPRDVDALEDRAEALAALEQEDKALADYDRLTAIQPNNLDWHNKKLRHLRSLKRYREAIDEDNKIFALSGTAHNLLERARDSIRIHDNKKAIADLEKSVSLKSAPTPEGGESADYADKTRAELYRKLNMPEKYFYFINKYIAATNDAESFSDALRQKKIYQIVLGHYDEVIADLDSPTERKHDSEKEFENWHRSELLLVTGKKNEALRLYQSNFNTSSESLRTITPPNTIYACHYVLILYKRLNGQKGFDQFARKTVDQIEGWLRRKKNPTEVAEEAVDLLELLPPQTGKELAQKILPILKNNDREDLKFKTFIVLLYLGDDAAAEEIIPESPSLRDSHYYHKRADAELNLGKKQEALRSARQAIKLNATRSCAFEPMVRAALANGELAEAQKYLDMIFDDDDGVESGSSYYLRSQLMAAKGDGEGARKNLRIAAALGDDQAIDALLGQ